MSEQILNKELKNYLQLLSIDQKISVLSLIKSFVTPSSTEKRISLKKYNAELEKSEKSIAAGKFFTQEQVEKLVKKW